MKVNKKIAILLSMVMVGSMFAGCANKDDSQSNEENTKKEEAVDQKTEATTKDDYNFDNNDYFTSLSWLEENMDKNDKLLIIDARAEKEYKAGHIPGAINVAWQSLAKVEGKAGEKDWGTLQDKEALSDNLSKLGIKKESQVVVYANKDGWGDDGRIVWCLQRAGIDARMLNGGFDLWSSEKKEVTKDEPKEIAKSDLKLDSIKPDLNISTDDLKKEYKELKIIDVRGEDEYKGATNFGEARGGHLPDAINITFAKLYNEDGTIKSNEEIDKVMKEAGVEKSDNIVTYCTAGIRSAHMALVLKNAGYENVRNYDASYYEWAGDESNQVEK